MKCYLLLGFEMSSFNKSKINRNVLAFLHFELNQLLCGMRRNAATCLWHLLNGEDTVCVCAPYGEVQQVLGSRCFQVLDCADPVQTLLKEELSWFYRTWTTTRVHRVQTVHPLPAWQLKDRTGTGETASLSSTVVYELQADGTKCESKFTRDYRWKLAAELTT